MSGRGAAFVEHLEQRYAISVPADFAAYLTTDVPETERMDAAGISWWAPDGIKSLTDELASIGDDSVSTDAEIQREAGQYLVFADFLCWCHAYAICCAAGPNRGRVALIGDRDGFVAESFDAFARLAREDSRRLHLPAGARPRTAIRGHYT